MFVSQPTTCVSLYPAHFPPLTFILSFVLILALTCHSDPKAVSTSSCVFNQAFLPTVARCMETMNATYSEIRESSTAHLALIHTATRTSPRFDFPPMASCHVTGDNPRCQRCAWDREDSWRSAPRSPGRCNPPRMRFGYVSHRVQGRS